MKMLKAFVRDESGATAIEYGLIAALIAVVIIAALTTLGRQVSGSFSKISSATQAAS
jgi:pilus assembly protein Flp/PilA